MTAKSGFIIGIFLFGTLLMVQPGFSQAKGEKVIFFSGFVEGVPKDAKYMVVYEKRIFLSETTIVDENGIVLKPGDLKRKLYIRVEAVQRSNDLFARKITVIKTPRVPGPRGPE